MSDEMPLLEIRNRVLFPGMLLRLQIGREKSVKLVESMWNSQNRSFKKGSMICINTITESSEETFEGESHVTESNPQSPSQSSASSSDTHLDIIDTLDSKVYRIGTIAKVLQLSRVTNSSSSKNIAYTLLVEGVSRAKIEKLVSTEPFNIVHTSWMSDQGSVNTTEVKALLLSVQNVSREFFEILKTNNVAARRQLKEVIETLEHISPGRLADLLAANIESSVVEKQSVLCETRILPRLRLVLELLNRQIEVLKISEKIQSEVEGKLKNSQREYYLRQQLRAINRELGSMNGNTSANGDMDDAELLQDRLMKIDLPEEVRIATDRELKRLKQMQPSQPEYSVIRSYLELVAELPWNHKTPDNLDVTHARMILDRDHHSLEKVKNRLVEFLAVQSLKQSMKGPILCLVGPPGVGKTSLGKSVAEALGRNFRRLALGGVRDEAEIRGHRRTYIGAMPGNIVHSINKAGSMNPVVLLDEVDKLGRDVRGDPASALLEVLDPEQNHTFVDHYLNVPLDLSQVLFIATANRLDTIPEPLLDRMEIIELSGYTLNEKYEIVTHHLIPKQLANHGITSQHVTFTEDAVKLIIASYTREAGVRNTDREIAAICRYVAVQVAKFRDGNAGIGEISETSENKASTDAAFDTISITPVLVQQILGPVKHESEIAQRTTVPGVATGLAWTPVGGEILFIEAWLYPGNGRIQVTGQLGKVMEESVRAALSLVRGNLEDFNLPIDIQNLLTYADIHVHFPAGGIPKDGPSAGVAITGAILSALSGRLIRSDTACTGEITLRGLVLPVGGIKEKVMAAHRAGIRRVLLPSRNEKDLVEIPLEVREAMEIFTVSTVPQAMKFMFEGQPAAATTPRWVKEVEVYQSNRKTSKTGTVGDSTGIDAITSHADFAGPVLSQSLL